MDYPVLGCLLCLLRLTLTQYEISGRTEENLSATRSTSNCSENSDNTFKCNDGTCIAKNTTCNGISECRLGEDESSVQCGCFDNEFLCEKSKRCIAMFKRCDKIVDCAEDQEDERDCETHMCSTMQFKCRNHFCISKELICNFKDDCGDGSDESGCSHRPCWPVEFRCNNSECIPYGWLCDGNADCVDYSDEMDCLEDICDNGRRVHQSHACNGWPDCSDHVDELHCGDCEEPAGYFQCPNTRCIQSSHKCDGFCDCLGDCSDEEDCNDFYLNIDGYVICKNGTTIKCSRTLEGKTIQRCIAKAFICDDVNDCQNGVTNLSDEYGCVEVAGWFPCSPPDTRFIPPEYVCDYSVDCLNGDDEDERICNRSVCSEDEFQCSSGQCINSTRRCDGRSDCIDFTDETQCREFFCPELSMDGVPLKKCRNGQCIDSTLWCDFIKDCADGSDEEDCGHARNCTDEEFACRTLQQCVPKSLRCYIDGEERSGCADLSHLEGCEDVSCSDTSLKCRNGPCIKESLRCDETVHCKGTWTDEQNCTHRCLNDMCLCLDRTINCTGRGVVIPAVFEDHYQNFYFAFNNLGDNLTPRSFQNMSTALVMDLSSNYIYNLAPGLFEALPLLLNLILQNNCITVLLNGTFRGLSQLNGLHLEGNKIQSIQARAFYGLSTLPTLNLRGQGLANISSGAFKGLSNLSSLDLSHNKLEYLSDGALQGMLRIKSLDLRLNPLQLVGRHVFRISSLQILQFDEFRFCCFARHVSQCLPTNEFSNCENLMSNVVLRVCIWILGIIATLGNLLVIGWRLKYKHSNQVHSFLITNLAIGDLLMGCYLLLIAIVDAHYRGVYSMYDKEWRTSRTCSMAGLLSTFSSELSVFTLTVITLDRFLVIIFPFKLSRLEMRQTRWVMLGVWTAAIFLSGLPLLQIDYFKDFYGRSGVCLALHITPEKYNGWEYSVFIFLFLNLVSFSIISVGYVVMYGVAKTTRLAVAKQADMARRAELAMARRMTLIVATDAACWVPIIFLGVLSLCGFTVPPQVFAWVAVFILPLNAAVNPILYTISTASFLDPATRNIRHFNRSFKLSLSTDPRTRRTYSTNFGSSINHSSRFDVYLHHGKANYSSAERNDMELVRMDTPPDRQDARHRKRSLVVFGNRTKRRWAKSFHGITTYGANLSNVEENEDSDYESEMGETPGRGNSGSEQQLNKQLVVVKQINNKQHVYSHHPATRWLDGECQYRWKPETCADADDATGCEEVRLRAEGNSGSCRRSSDRRRRKKTDSELYD